MDCWVCGSKDADTREHRGKASDLRSVFGKPSQEKPLYFHTAKLRNKHIRSLKADILKFTHRICLPCNSALTQPYDFAWQYCSEALRENYHHFRLRKFFRANRIFPYLTRRRMRHVHLYFVKAFGCLIVEGDIPIDLGGFSLALREQKLHPDMYIRFGHFPGQEVKVVGASNVHVEYQNNQVVSASWFYDIGQISVNVLYAKHGVNIQGLENSWNPKFGAKRIIFHQF